ncbi:hypothetical protein, partial [Corynebacterium lehmanniae]
PLVTPRALKSRGHQNPPPDCYWMLTNALLDTHHGVTRYDRVTLAVAEPSNRVWRLFAMRDDREGHGIGKLVSNNFDISRLGDGDYRFVDPLFNIVNNFKLVCTDRMHVAIVGAMLGRKVMLVEGNYAKSRDVFKSSIEKSFPNVTLHSAKDFSDWVAGR